MYVFLFSLFYNTYVPVSSLGSSSVSYLYQIIVPCSYKVDSHGRKDMYHKHLQFTSILLFQISTAGTVTLLLSSYNKLSLITNNIRIPCLLLLGNSSSAQFDCHASRNRNSHRFKFR